MLLSMTGFGEASRQNDSLAVGVEVRTINSRYFKLTVRSGEGYCGAWSRRSMRWSGSTSSAARCRYRCA